MGILLPMPARLRVSVVIIGDEILGGFVQDTNSGWLAKRFQSIGIPLDRIHTVPDDIEAINEALQLELARARPRVILTSGGVGSTPDDVTFEAVAASLGQPLAEEPAIAELIGAGIRRADASGVGLSEEHARSLWKMALVPQQAYPLPGAPGVNPGVAVDVDGGSAAGGATIVILPGIPSELRRIVTDRVEPALLAGHGLPQHVEELRHPYPESFLNPVLDRIVAEFPEVHVGSYPGLECTIRLKGPQPDVMTAIGLVNAFLDELSGDETARRLSADWQARWASAFDES